jgi:hypothetical protein
MFGYVMKNKLENNLLIFFFKFIKIIRNKLILQIKKLNENKIEKNLIS